MKREIIIPVLLIITFINSSKAQTESVDTVSSEQYRKSIFIEGLGSGIVGSVNFDMRLKRDQNHGWGIRAGLGQGYYYSISLGGGADIRYISVPLVINYIAGKKRSGLEGGIGITGEVAPQKSDVDPGIKLDGVFHLGYRYQPINSGIMFRINGSLFYSRGRWGLIRFGSKTDLPWPGVSLGYSFK